MFRLYVREGCPYCEMAKELFKSQKVPFETVSLNDDPIILAGIRHITGSLNATVPVIVAFITQTGYIEIIVGYDANKINTAIASYRLLSPKPVNANT